MGQYGLYTDTITYCKSLPSALRQIFHLFLSTSGGSQNKRETLYQDINFNWSVSLSLNMPMMKSAPSWYFSFYSECHKIKHKITNDFSQIPHLEAEHSTKTPYCFSFTIFRPISGQFLFCHGKVIYFFIIPLNLSSSLS